MPAGYEVIPFSSDTALAQAVAARWLAQLPARSPSGQPYLVALSGGRIALRLFAELATQGRHQPHLFSAVHFWWADERCVPPDHADSNYLAAKEQLLNPLSIASGFTHRLGGELTPELAVSQANAELQAITGIRPPAQPSFDLIFLGMGEDGHIASLFPGESDQDIVNPDWFRAVIGPKPPPQRITMGYPLLAAAKEVWVLASGKGKEQALRESLAPGGRTPLGRLLGLRTHTRIFTDIPQP